ncbi:polyphenol oxidase family protein [Psychromicrobium lacuslunae]|uniref:Copper oxidase n=1 Tax=Psychromicrobium lacuslunae TaxID=1618207 RepID=A0A0D4BX69_9MICC|nr:polyphenol oxidase family protein [Psychromicrobium lacuslunae]AJT40720.1 hypothetical protein UM93_02885 [Psychromicrobium lacuslunae]
MFFWRREVRPGWGVAFSDIRAGSLSLNVPADSAARQHRESLREELRLETGFQFMSQVHGRELVEVERAGQQPTADGLISASLPLAVLVADCLPVILLAERATETISAAVHAGRQGVLNGIVPAAIERLTVLGAEQVEAWIGPAICAGCYEVPEQMRAESTTQFPELYASTSWGTPSLDLRAGATAQLERAGVLVNQVEVCTREEPGLFSHRASQQTGRQQGRFAGLVYRTRQR